LETLYSNECFRFLIEEHKLEVKLLEEKKGKSTWRKRKNGNLKTEIYGFR
jgi:hypothetical protein